MNAKKKRTKDRRRARKLAEQAWDAIDDDENYDLALKLARRGIELAPGNPQLRNDEGLMLQQTGDDAQAAESFQAAISLAPDFAEAYAHLAGIRARQGRLQEAVALQTEAVRHAPESNTYRQGLVAYQALCGTASSEPPGAPPTGAVETGSQHCPLEHARRGEFSDLATRVDALDWAELESVLTGQGFAMIDRLIEPRRCAELRGLAEQSSLFDKTVVMNKSRFGQGVYRYFRAPLPPLVDAIRRLVYPHAAAIANAWQRLLGESELYPTAWEDFRLRCAQAGQTTPTPLLLSYEAGGFNALHRDIRGEVFFPLQLVIVLSRRLDPEQADEETEGFVGGEFLFCDVPERKKSHRRGIPAGLGDAVLFCTTARLARVASVYGLRPVKHGMDRITHGTRHALGVPFHEYE